MNKNKTIFLIPYLESIIKKFRKEVVLDPKQEFTEEYKNALYDEKNDCMLATATGKFVKEGKYKPEINISDDNFFEIENALFKLNNRRPNIQVFIDSELLKEKK